MRITSFTSDLLPLFTKVVAILVLVLSDLYHGGRRILTRAHLLLRGPAGHAKCHLDTNAFRDPLGRLVQRPRGRREALQFQTR